MRSRLYKWWKKTPSSIRKPAAFTAGLIFILISPLVGWLPGPGGIVIFLLGITILSSEFGWAENLHNFFLKTVPKEVKRRWQPTPKWEAAFDITSLLLILGAITAIYVKWWTPVLSLSIGGICLFLFNKDRLGRLKKKLNNINHKK